LVLRDLREQGASRWGTSDIDDIHVDGMLKLIITTFMLWEVRNEIRADEKDKDLLGFDKSKRFHSLALHRL